MMRTIILVALLTTCAIPLASAEEPGDDIVEYSIQPTWVKVNAGIACVMVTPEFPFVSLGC